MGRGVIGPAALVASLLLVAACAVDGRRAVAPTASAAAVEERWTPPSGAPRAIILALHGFNDRKAAFEEFGAYAAARGVLVEAYDQSGFGGRANRGTWPGVEVLTAEARARARDLLDQNPGVPVYVLGESMGGAVAAAAFGDPDAPPVAGVILAAPAVWGGKELSPLYRTILTAANLVVPWVRLTGRGLKIMASDNIPGLIRLGRDPLYIRATRIDAITGLVRLMDQASELGPKLGGRLLVLTGARDQVVPPKAQADFIASLPASGCEAVTYLNGWHLLLLDLQRERVFADILAWIDGRRLPSGLNRPCGKGQASSGDGAA